VGGVTPRWDRYRLWIFDADDTLRGTTIPDRPCPREAGEWRLLDGVQATLRQVRWNTAEGPWIGVASNQDQVGTGLIRLETARELLREMIWQAAGVRLDDSALQLCPHALGVPCDCRKPAPAMLERLMAHYRIRREDTVFVGDKATDRMAAAAAGVAFAHPATLFGWCQSA
jgi:D-glycero-D-manno-heptose 1,7-bisphosphate phosphatase